MGLYSSFAAILEYPTADLPRRLDQCLTVIGESSPLAAVGPHAVAGAVAALHRFRSEIERLGLTRMEEAYTASFDMEPGCTLYAGHHLFGETEHRSLFMVRLSDTYRQAGFARTVADLPDWLPTMLRFVDGLGAADESRRILVAEAIAPAARAIAVALDRRQDPYAPVMRALVAVLEADVAAGSGNPVKVTP